MIKLTDSLAAWGTAEFKEVLKGEISRMDAKSLPLQQGMSLGSYAKDDNISATILNVSEDEAAIHVKAGIFFTSIIAGCSCAYDPTPLDEQNEYCDVQLDIDKTTGETRIMLIQD